MYDWTQIWTQTFGGVMDDDWETLKKQALGPYAGESQYWRVKERGYPWPDPVVIEDMPEGTVVLTRHPELATLRGPDLVRVVKRIGPRSGIVIENIGQPSNSGSDAP
jgi:hypothetical protein